MLLSSHLLHEIEVIADDLVLIGNGRIVAQGTKVELLHAAGTVVRSAPGNPRRSLEAAGIATTVSPDGAVRTTGAGRVGQVALAAGLALTDSGADAAGLEEMFLELTAETQREGAAA